MWGGESSELPGRALGSLHSQNRRAASASCGCPMALVDQLSRLDLEVGGRPGEEAGLGEVSTFARISSLIRLFIHSFMDFPSHSFIHSFVGSF